MLLSIIYSLGIAQAFLLAYFLLRSRYELWQGNLYLSQLLLCIAVILSLFLARIHLGNSIPALLFWPITALPALFGPLLYFYVTTMQPNTRQSLVKHWHLIPFGLLILLYIPQMMTPLSDGISHIDDRDIRVKIIIASYLKSASIISYLLISLRCTYQQSFVEALPASSLSIFRRMLVSFLAVAVLGCVLSILYWTGIYVSLWADFLELSFLTLLTYMLSIYVLFKHVSPLHPNTRYAKTNLNTSTRKQIAQQLTELMANQQIFTREHYSAKFLCEQLGITEQNLSEVLALNFDSNFYDYSNQYRLDYFKQLVREDPTRNLLALALQAGFTSKSSFNRTVKSITGLTPTQLRSTLISN